MQQALINCSGRQGSFELETGTGITSRSPNSQSAEASQIISTTEPSQLEPPKVKPFQVPELRIECPPDEVEEAQSRFTSSAPIPHPPIFPLDSKEASSSEMSRLEEDCAPGQSGKQLQPASSSAEAPDIYDIIDDLARCPNGTKSKFVPEHSLRNLFKQPGGELERYLGGLVATKKLDATASQIPRLVSFICDKAPKVFATLVFSSQEHHILRFLENDLGDELLPVVRDQANRFMSQPAEAGVELTELDVRLANDESSEIQRTKADPRKKEEALAKAQAKAQVAGRRHLEAREVAEAAARKVGATFKGLTRRDINPFCDQYQWRFMAPVFTEADFSYMFDDKTEMPFWPSSDVRPRFGPFSSVEKMQAHRDHLPPNINNTFVRNDRDHPFVAVKTLRRDQFRTGKEFEEAFQLERKVLEVMKSLKDPHLIRTIACYRKGPKNDCFVFPWADLGNLRDYWERRPLGADLKERLVPAYLRWVFTQLRGLAHAISLLHDENIRHGDLKPENILCFRDSSSKNRDNMCMLVIADAGLAKINYQATQLRTQATIGPHGSTLMYEPPEAEAEAGNKKPKSRRYDVWSMGCICLEFLIWIVDGELGLKIFRNNLAQNNKFYKPHWSKDQQRVTGAGRQPEVDEYMRELRERSCTQGERNPLRRLVELIDKKLLVHNLGKPITMPRLSPSNLQVGVDGTASVPDGFRSFSRADTTMMDIFEVPPGSRVRSSTMLEEFEGILADGESFNLPAAALNRSAARPPPPASSTQRHKQHGPEQSLGVSGGNKATFSGSTSSSLDFGGSRKLVLDDSWEYAADTEFPVEDIEWSTDLIPSTVASNLCPRCKALRLWAPTCSFSDTLDGLTDKATTCALCHLLLQHTINRIDQNDEIIYFFRVMSYITFGDKRGQPIVSLYTVPGVPSLSKHEIQTGFPELPEAGSSTHIQILSKWISSCDMCHPCLSLNLNFVPTRLLDVGNADSESIRLVEKHLGDSNPRRYLALSHRWGSPKLHPTFCTLTDNIMLFKQYIHVKDLPKTFQDAVEVTRSLGVQYLWIDSLCIIQDDPNDWDTESKLMEQVFSSAYVTISASCSRGTDDGFLKPRPTRECVTAQLPGENGAFYYLCDSIDDFRHDVDEGELSKRAWVLQERALSKRTIYFSRTQSYWECGQGVRCETLTKMKNQRASFLGDSNFPHSVDAFVKGMKIELCQGLYERFSNLEITFPGDRPVAIKGLETRLMRTLNTTGGFGIFEVYLHRCLLWQRSDKSLKRITVFNGPKVPSWSWMAYMGGIRYLEAPYGSVAWEDDLVSPYSSGAGKYNSAQGQVPRIEAVAWDFTSDMTIFTIGDQQGPRRVILDEPDSDRVRCLDGVLKCVIVGRSKQVMNDEEQARYVLIIRTSTLEDDSTRVWERIGVGVLMEKDIALQSPGVKVFIQ